MKPWLKKSLYILTAILLVAATFVAGLFIKIHSLESKLQPVTMPFSEMQRIPMCINRIFPLSDLEKSFGFADYVFIGTVEEILGTEYDDIHLTSFTLYENSPETHFKVRTVWNIKGNVPKEFTLKTYGGQQPNGMLEEFNPMPEDKSTCLFMCTESEGEIYFFNCVYLNGVDWDAMGKDADKIIEKYKKVYENQDLSMQKYR